MYTCSGYSAGTCGHVVAKRCTHAVVTLLVHGGHVVAKRCTHAVVTLLVHGRHVVAKRCTHAVVTGTWWTCGC